jgi:hypothetical protein
VTIARETLPEERATSPRGAIDILQRNQGWLAPDWYQKLNRFRGLGIAFKAECRIIESRFAKGSAMTEFTKMAIKLPRELKEWIDREAERDDRSLNSVVVRTLRARMQQDLEDASHAR